MRALAAGGIVAAGFCLVFGIFSFGLSDRNAAERDFIEYWAAGHLLVQGHNPYDATAILELERGAGLNDSEPRITYSPPVALFVVLPLGFMGAKNGLIFWLLAQLACLSLAIFVLWILLGRPDSRYHLLGYVFAPALASLMAGQLGIFLLLGIVLFLYFHPSRPFVAGVALIPCCLKPHLFLPFAVVLLLWIVMRKAYRIPAGFALMLAASSAVTLGFDHSVWTQYSQMMGRTGVLQAFVPTLGVTLRFLIAQNAVWMQLVPEAAACVWALWYFLTRRDDWDWMKHGLLLLLVGVVCTPYGWFSDEAVLLPAVLVGLVSAIELRRSVIPLALVAGAALIEVLCAVRMDDLYYLWTPPAWLAVYLLATHGAPSHLELSARKNSAP